MPNFDIAHVNASRLPTSRKSQMQAVAYDASL
jgi:hypothetical protein